MKKLMFFISIIFIATTGFSQTENSQTKTGNTDTVKQVIYTCSMHPEIQSNKPGKCPKCGMNLLVKKEEVKKIFTCPMHKEVLKSKPGKCPICNMNLIEKKIK